MKKNIFIVRHGHADFDADIDFNRPLTTRGIQAVKQTTSFIAKQAKKQQLNPQICISSAAKRTQQTAEIICQTLAIQTYESHKELYATNVSKWLEYINQQQTSDIIIVGHNPTLSQMVNTFCGYNLHLKPANCAFIQLEIKPDGIVYPANLLALSTENTQIPI